MEVVIIDNMEGNIYIKGNLYVTDDMIPALLSKNGLVIRVKKDVIFLSEKDKVTLEYDDVFIENIFANMVVKDIVAFSALVD
jgi:hypothetical protein